MPVVMVVVVVVMVVERQKNRSTRTLADAGELPFFFLFLGGSACRSLASVPLCSFACVSREWRYTDGTPGDIKASVVAVHKYAPSP